MLGLEVAQVTSRTHGGEGCSGNANLPRPQEAERQKDHPLGVVMVMKGLKVQKAFGRVPGAWLHTLCQCLLLLLLLIN